MAQEDFAYKAGLNSVGSYQLSGIPWVTSSLSVPGNASSSLRVTFPNITKFVIVKNTDANSDVSVGFSARGVETTKNYFALAPSESLSADLRVKNLFLLSATTASATVTILAGMTGIDSGQLINNNWSGSAGVG